jgi:aminopeptidase N
VTGEGRAESLIAHEIAHQWFGNSVTEGDWHHIWLSEGFATYLTSVYMEMNYGEERLKESMRNDRNRIVRNLEMMSHPVVDTAVTNLMRLLNVNSYQKGSWVLHMLRSEMGEMNFWTGMRNYYERFRNGNALTEDFRKIMEEAGGKNLESFFNQWLYAAGHPVLKASLRPGKKKGVSELIIEQTQDQLFEFSIEFSLKDKNGIRIITVPVRDKVTFVNVKASADAEVIPDPRVKLLFSLHADQ